MADVATALDLCKDIDQSLGRLQLQKLIYFGDVLAETKYLLSLPRRYKTYTHGPYDFSVQNAVDALAFRGFVNIISLGYRPDGTIQASYEITDAGRDWVRRLITLHAFANKKSLYAEIVNNLSRIGFNILKDLVYQEPTYLRTRTKGWGYTIPLDTPQRNLSIKLLDFIEIKAKRVWRVEQIREEILTFLFFEFLKSSFDEKKKKQAIPDIIGE